MQHREITALLAGLKSIAGAPQELGLQVNTIFFKFFLIQL